MQLVQLLYCSKSIQAIHDSVIDSILESSRKNNPAMNITGLLCNNEAYFLQLLEGDYRAVNDLYNRIAQDDRHEKLTLLYYRSVKKRAFPQWSMGHIERDQYINDLICKFPDNTTMLEVDVFGDACINYMQGLNMR